MAMVKRTVRTRARALAGGLAAAVPANAAEKLRGALAAAAPGSRWTALEAQALELIRLRGLPPGIERFTVDADGGDVTLVAAESAIAERLYWLGRHGWEPEFATWWPRACAIAERVTEVGANIGYLTVLGAKANPAAAYTAVEPHPAAAAVLRRNLEANGAANVTVVEAAALTEKSDRVELRVPPADRHAVPRSAYVDHPLRLRQWQGSVDVPAVRLDEVMGDALLLDAEGWEWSLLADAVDHLTAAHPMLFVAVSQVLAEDRRLLLELLASGYLALAPDDGALTALDQRELLRRLVRAPRVTRLVLATGDQLDKLVRNRALTRGKA